MMRAKLFTLILTILAPFIVSAQGLRLIPDNAYQGDSLMVTIMSATPFQVGSPTSGTITAYMGTYTGQGSNTNYTYFMAATSTITGASTLQSTFYIPIYQDSGYYDFYADFPYNYIHQDTAFYVNTNLGGNGSIGGNLGSGHHKTDAAPLVGVKVILQTSFGNTRLITRTDPNGNYVFLHLPAGTYSVQVAGLDNTNTPSYTLSNNSTTLTHRDLIVDNGAVYSGIEEPIAELNAFAVVPSIFTNEAKVTYQLAALATVELNVYDVSGKLLINRKMGSQQVGDYSVDINTAVLPAAGIYFFEVRANGKSLVQKGIKQ